MKLLFTLFVGFIIGDRVTAHSDKETIRLPAEWEPHERTFMVWQRKATQWSDDVMLEMWKDVARIANAIVKFEPVIMFAAPDEVTIAEDHLDRRVKVVAMEVDDLWARDTLPTFVSKEENEIQNIVGTIFNFNGWGVILDTKDSKLAREFVEMYDLESRTAKIVAEGGNFETDGRGTLLVIRNSLVNTNRNHQSQEEIEMELKNVLGVKKVIWFEGVLDDNQTEHIDCLVRFARPGVVFLNRMLPGEDPYNRSRAYELARSVLESSTDANGNPFEIIDLFEPDPEKVTCIGDKKDLMLSYVNFFIGNGFVIVPTFGDDSADLNAQNILRRQFPERVIVPVQLVTLPDGGGGIHCATHEQPAIKQKKSQKLN